MGPGVLINIAALGLLVAVVARLAYPATEAIRLRNAMLLRPAGPRDFAWTPDDVPADFRRDAGPAEGCYVDIVRALRLDGLSDWDKARTLAAHLVERAAGKGPIQS